MNAPTPTKQPQIGTAVFLLKPNGSFLIGHRLSQHGFDTWGLAGGHPEYGEDPVVAVARETREETGIRIDPEDTHFAGYSSDIDPKNGKHYVTMFFICRIDSAAQAKVSEPDKIDEWRWVFYDELPANLMPQLQGFLNKMGPNGLRHLMATAPRAAAAA